MEALTKAVGLLMIFMVALQVMLLLYRMAAHKWIAARLDGEFLLLLRQLSASVPETPTVSDEKREPSWKGKREFLIAWREYETPNRDICSFYLTPCDGKPLPQFRPGQYLKFELNIPGQPEPVTRCYSLSDSPTERQYYRITVRRMHAPAQATCGTLPGLSSNHFHEDMRVGDVVEAYSPSGKFCLDTSSPRPLILIAGGVGVTPLLSMLNWLAASSSEREVWLFYGVTNRSDHAMYEHLQSICGEMPNFHIVTFYANPTQSCRLGVDYDFAGFVSIECMKSLLHGRSCEFYVCGPPAMMKKVTADLQQWGVPQQQILTESFGLGPTSQRGLASTSNLLGVAEKMEVTFLRSKQTVEWTANMGSLLDLAEASGIKARFNCRAGSCGTCAIALFDGDVEYNEPPAAALAEGFCLPCIARPRSNLAVDL